MSRRFQNQVISLVSNVYKLSSAKAVSERLIALPMGSWWMREIPGRMAEGKEAAASLRDLDKVKTGRPTNKGMQVS